MTSPNSALGDLEALLLLSRTPGLRLHGLRAWFDEGLRPLEVAERIASGRNPAWRESLEATRRVFDPAREVESADQARIRLISFRDSSYPALLREISDPPLVLYVRGDLLDLDQAAVALVGSRHPGLYGREQAARFGRRLAEMGLTIVSGFARGIDHAAHEAALEVSHGRTIAVLGSGLDVIYPKEHASLYAEISERGAVVSEFALGTPPLAENFPKRNRIIAGLSLGVLVIEAHSRSGSLITAHLAADEGREVFALPGRVDQLGSRGTHRLLKEGAALVESPEEVLHILSPGLWSLGGSRKEEGQFSEEEGRLLALFETGCLTTDQAAASGGTDVPQTAALLTRLEIKGAVKRRLDGRYEKI